MFRSSPFKSPTPTQQDKRGWDVHAAAHASCGRTRLKNTILTLEADQIWSNWHFHIPLRGIPRSLWHDRSNPYTAVVYPHLWYFERKKRHPNVRRETKFSCRHKQKINMYASELYKILYVHITKVLFPGNVLLMQSHVSCTVWHPVCLLVQNTFTWSIFYIWLNWNVM